MELGTGPTVCFLECIGIEGNIGLTVNDEFPTANNLSLNYKTIQGIGIGTNITIGEYNKYGLLVMLGESRKYSIVNSSRIEESQFFLLNISPFSVKIGYRTIR